MIPSLMLVLSISMAPCAPAVTSLLQQSEFHHAHFMVRSPQRVNPRQNAKLKWQGVVINLDRRPERMGHFIQQTSGKQDLRGKFCRLSGTDGHDQSQLDKIVQNHMIDPALMEEVRAREEAQKQTAYYNLTFGTIGCYMSHFRAMKYIADNEAVDFGVVAEDDLSLFSPDFEKQFDKLVDDSEGQATKLWNSTDFIYLQACHLGWNRATIVKERLEIRTVLKDVSHQTVHCLGMYAVSRRAARWLTAPNGPLLPMKLQIDEILPVEVPNIRAKAFYPSIAQTLGSKDIGTDNQILLEPSDEPITWVDC